MFGYIRCTTHWEGPFIREFNEVRKIACMSSFVVDEGGFLVFKSEEGKCRA